MTLTARDKKYYGLTESVLKYLSGIIIKPSDRVLEVGPGEHPFRRADMYVDFINWKNVDNSKLLLCDVNKERLPFKDKEFDFVFCRHILEDLYNPFHLMEEMSRVGKAGYIETPSPIAELCRGIDGGSPPFRGFHHHRFIMWGYGKKEFRAVTKFPIIEYMRFDEARLAGFLQLEKYWNTHFLWEDSIQWKHLESPFNFQISRDLSTVLDQAINASKEAEDMFFFDIETKSKVA